MTCSQTINGPGVIDPSLGTYVAVVPVASGDTYTLPAALLADCNVLHIANSSLSDYAIIETPALADLIYQDPLQPPFAYFELPPAYGVMLYVASNGVWTLRQSHIATADALPADAPWSGMMVDVAWATIDTASYVARAKYANFPAGPGTWTIDWAQHAVNSTPSSDALTLLAPLAWEILANPIDININFPGQYEITHQAKISGMDPASYASMSSSGPGWSPQEPFSAAVYAGAASEVGVSRASWLVLASGAGAVQAEYSTDGGTGNATFEHRMLSVRPIYFG
jgi:hypothetical protein